MRALIDGRRLHRPAEAADHPHKLQIAGKVKDVASIHSTLWPEREEQGTGIMGGLKVYSQQTVIAVQTLEDAREGLSGKPSVSE